MKRKAILFLLLILLMIKGQSVLADDFIISYDDTVTIYTGSFFNLTVNGKTPNMPLPPLIFNERSLVPVREVFEALGAHVVYDEVLKSVSIDYDNNSVTIFINKPTAYVNGKKANIPDDVSPKLIAEYGSSAKTMVPVRFISENLGFSVNFSDNTIAINTPDYTPPAVSPTPTPTPAPDTTPAPAEEPLVNQAGMNTLNDFSYTGLSDDAIQFTLLTSARIGGFSKFTLDNPNRVVVDLPNCNYTLPKNSFDVNACGVTTIRFGYENNRTRIVIDCNTINSYNVTYNTLNQLTISINNGTNVPVENTTPQQTPSTDSSDINNIPSISYDNQTKVIVLDAGHGGSDSGAVGRINGQDIYEKNIVLSVTKKVRSVLNGWGYTVLLTREDDTYPTLTARGNFANQSNAAIFVSIHANSNDNSEPYGIETYYAPLNSGNEYGKTSGDLAQNILTYLINATGGKNRGVKTANHVVTRTSLMPAALIEIGFISNQNELSLLLNDDYQNKIASGIATGIAETITGVTIPENLQAIAQNRINSLTEWENNR